MNFWILVSSDSSRVAPTTSHSGGDCRQWKKYRLTDFNKFFFH